MNQRIVVLGGGFAALEAAFYLRWRLGPHADILLIAERESFAFRPNLVLVPFGGNPLPMHIPLEPATRAAGVRLFLERVRDVDFAACMVLTEDGPVSYDRLVIATGAAARKDQLPGLAEHGHTIETPEAMLALRAELARLVARAREGHRQSIVFAVPRGQVSAGPLVELALRTDAWLRRQRVRDRVRLTWTTPEKHYLEAFGPRLDAEVEREFTQARILGHRGESPAAVRPGVIAYTSGFEAPFDLLVATSPLVASVRYTGAPADEDGFLRVRGATRQVEGLPDVYAVGDASAFHVKQALLACLQADAAAEHIASRWLGTTPEFRYDNRSPWVLERYDRAAFAQIPLREAAEDAGAGPPRPRTIPGVTATRAWRFVRKMLGVYLPRRFRQGRPVHAGMVWRSLQFGLETMTASLAPRPADTVWEEARRP